LHGMQEVGGSIPPSSTKVLRGRTMAGPGGSMYRAGLIAIYIGIGLVAVGLIVGFTLMFMGNDNLAKFLIGLVPVGFLCLLTGTVTTLLSPPKDKQ
jgi:hypothetical protein